MKLPDSFFAMAGFAAKAGALLSGYMAVEKALLKGSLKLVIADESLSAGTLKKISEACLRTKTPIIMAGPPGSIGGRTGRAGTLLFGIRQKNFADRLLEIYRKSANNTEV